MSLALSAMGIQRLIVLWWCAVWLPLMRRIESGQVDRPALCMMQCCPLRGAGNLLRQCCSFTRESERGVLLQTLQFWRALVNGWQPKFVLRHAGEGRRWAVQRTCTETALYVIGLDPHVRNCICKYQAQKCCPTVYQFHAIVHAGLAPSAQQATPTVSQSAGVF